MPKYEQLIAKIQTIQNPGDFNQTELALITETLETIQVLEIILKARKKNTPE